MRIYPSITENYHSPLPPKELLRRLQRETSNAVFEFRTEEFKGQISTDGFMLRRLSWYTSVISRPTIVGQVRLSYVDGGSEVAIQQHITPINYWTSISLSLLMSILLGGIFMNDSANIVGLILWLIASTMLFGFALASLLLPFWLAVRTSRTLLVKMLLLQAASSL